MNVETLIYAYLAVCASMILFNCACIVVFKRRDRNLKTRSRDLEESFKKQMEIREQGGHVEEGHKAFLKRHLGRIQYLLAFDEMLEVVTEDHPETTKRYLEEIYDVFVYLAVAQPYRDVTKVTYFAYVIEKYKVVRDRPRSPVMDLMMNLLQDKSIYCRENALKAICSSGDCRSVVLALKQIDESAIYYSQKLLTEDLLSFEGDHVRLSEELWEEWNQFSLRMQLAVLDYFRFGGRKMQKELLQLMEDESQDDEIRFSCIRYFGKYPYAPAYPVLIGFAGQNYQRRWEYAAIASASLSSYESAECIQVLKQNLGHSNWYVRLNVVKSLSRFHLTYNDLSDILEGNDRYAREILQYQLDMEKLRQSQREQGDITA